jgi:hypothetical protein
MIPFRFISVRRDTVDANVVRHSSYQPDVTNTNCCSSSFPGDPLAGILVDSSLCIIKHMLDSSLVYINLRI